VFLDADVLLRKPLDGFLNHRAFSGFEEAGRPFTAVWGAEAGHPWPGAALAILLDDDRVESLPPTNTVWMSSLLAEQFAIEPDDDTFQIGSHGVAIYPSSTFCVDLPTSFAVHYFAGSWLSAELEGLNWRAHLLRRYESARHIARYEERLQENTYRLSLAALSGGELSVPEFCSLLPVYGRALMRMSVLLARSARAMRVSRRPARGAGK
jgi:hypothetical protein